ncbi:MAG: DsrE family protein [Bacteroidetes bacterium]|nr:DsrE family protein [Bacteroidota bacterium]
MKDQLYILWTTGDPVTAEKMVLMYVLNSKLKGWWSEVTVVIWGASAEVVARDKKIQAGLSACMDAGIKIEACKACADQLGVTESMEHLGVDVKYYGEPLTKILKSEGKLLTI